MLFVLEFVIHLCVQAFLKISFPLWVIGIGLFLDFDVALNGNLGGVGEVDGNGFTVFV